MEIVESPAELIRYMSRPHRAGVGARPILIDKYMEGKEVEVDAICDGEAGAEFPASWSTSSVPACTQATVSLCSPRSGLAQDAEDQVVAHTVAIARALQVRGFINIQFVVKDGTVYVLEANLRSSRTIPFVSKAAGAPLVPLAVRVMLGAYARRPRLSGGHAPAAAGARLGQGARVQQREARTARRAARARDDVDRRSDGEDATLPGALYRALVGAGIVMPKVRALLASVADRDKSEALPLIRRFAELGFTVYATDETARFLKPRRAGDPCLEERRHADRAAPDSGARRRARDQYADPGAHAWAHRLHAAAGGV